MIKKIIVFTCALFTIFSSHCMELSPRKEASQKKSSKEKMQRSKSKSLLSLSRKSSEEKSLTISPRIEEHPFIEMVKETIHSKCYDSLKFCLTNPYFDPNILSKDGFSALHLFAKNEDCNGIEIIIKDPRADFSIKDIDQHLASHYIDKNKLALKDLLHSMFIRGSIDIITQRECAHIQSFRKKYMTDMKPLFEIKVKIIQSKLLNMTSAQNADTADGTRRFEIVWPKYATDEFMFTKMWFILSSLTDSKKTSEEK
jgi:hypothetical protein